MKNIFYLIQSTRLANRRQVYFGITNYLYRQLLIHNHRWHPKEKERQRPPCPGTLKKYGWQPFVAVTGFQNPTETEFFYRLFKSQVIDKYPKEERIRVPNLIVTRPIDAHLEALGNASKIFMEKTFDRLLQGNQASKLTQLTFYYDQPEHYEKFGSLSHPDVLHEPYLDVAHIDRLCYDPLDEDDDRNYRRLKLQRQEQQKMDQLRHLSKELEIPLEEMEQVLERSRLSVKETLIKQKGKVSKKAEKYIL